MFWRKKKEPQEEEIDRLISSMKSKDVGESLSAVSSIVKIGSSSPEVIGKYLIPMMPKLFGDKNIRLRTRAGFILSGLISTSPELRGDLVRLALGLLRHKDRLMRLYAAGLLGRVAAEAPEHLKIFMDEIMALLGERDKLRVADASFALGEIGFRAPSLVEGLIPKMTDVLKKKDGFTVISLKRICLKSPILIKDSIPQLIDVIKGTRDLSMSWDLSIMLIQLSIAHHKIAQELVLPQVEKLLEDKSGLARAAAVYIIGEIGIRRPDFVKKYLPKLINLTTDTDSKVRIFLALSLGRMCYRSSEFAERLTPELMKMIYDINDNVRGAAAVSLRYVAANAPEQVEELLPQLSKMLEDKNQIARGFASLSLRLVSEVISSDIASEIIGRISDGAAEGNVHVRRGAAVTLHRISNHPDPEIDREILLEAINLLEDKDSNVKMHAVLSLSNLVSTFPDIVKAQVPRIMELLDDKDWNLRMQASIALGEIGNYCQDEMRKLVLTKLVKMLEHKDQRIRNATALSLGKLL